jgi:hypothetical protein
MTSTQINPFSTITSEPALHGTGVVYKTRYGELIIRGMRSLNDVAYTSNKFGSINITAALEYASEHGARVSAQLNVADVLRSMLNVDLDMDHVIKLNNIQYAELRNLTVALYIDMEDGTHLLVDGNHRIAVLAARSARAGIETIEVKSFVLSRAQAEPFRIRYFAVVNGIEREVGPDELLDEISGVYTQPDGTIRDHREKTS